MIFLVKEKIAFSSQDIQVFVLLVNPQTLKPVMSSEKLLKLHFQFVLES